MRNKQYSSEMKEMIVLEYFKGGISIEKLAEKHSVNKNTVAKWIKKAKDSQTPSEDNAVIDVTSAIQTLAAVPEGPDPEMISFRLNGSFEIEMRKSNLKAFLEAMRDAGM